MSVAAYRKCQHIDCDDDATPGYTSFTRRKHALTTRDAPPTGRELRWEDEEDIEADLQLMQGHPMLRVHAAQSSRYKPLNRTVDATRDATLPAPQFEPSLLVETGMEHKATSQRKRTDAVVSSLAPTTVVNGDIIYYYAKRTPYVSKNVCSDGALPAAKSEYADDDTDAGTSRANARLSSASEWLTIDINGGDNTRDGALPVAKSEYAHDDDADAGTSRANARLSSASEWLTIGMNGGHKATSPCKHVESQDCEDGSDNGAALQGDRRSSPTPATPRLLTRGAAAAVPRLASTVTRSVARRDEPTWPKSVP